MKVASAPSIVIPAPSALADEPDPLARVRFLSSTSSVAVFRVVVVPLTVKLPDRVKSAAAMLPERFRVC